MARPASPFAADARLICGVKNMPPGRSTAAQQRVERIHRERVEHPIRVRQRRSADDSDRWTDLSELTRQSLDCETLATPVICLDLLRVEVTQT